MTVQVRKVASISVLCSLLYIEGGGSPKTEVHFAYMRKKKQNKDNHVRVYGILDAMVLMIIKGCLSFKCLQRLVSNKDCSGVYVYDKVNDFSELTLHHSTPGLT